ncbi:MAG: MBL fold metallo-hydrolase [Candidatus Micrarchaeota archaeon]|nr:MBL fold metallo-hydrolase [Candidatus Micrarchaeota archaeon]
MVNSTVFSGVKITLFGHSSVLLEGEGVRIYADPFTLPRAAQPADAILYTHGHTDHCAPAPSITTPRTVIIGHGCKIPGRVIQIGGKEKVGTVEIEAVPAYNINKPFHPKDSGAGFLVRFRSCVIYIAGDTDLIPEMEKMKCDVAIVPIGGTYTMDSREASDAIAILKPKITIPYHYNYLSDTRTDPREFQTMVEEKTGRKTVVRVLI